VITAWRRFGNASQCKGRVMQREQPSIIQSVNLWVQTIAIVLAGIWAIYQFVWKEFVQPAFVSFSINGDIDATADPAQRIGEALPIKLDIKIQNTSKRDLRVIGALITVEGVEIATLPFSDPLQLQISSREGAENVLKHSWINWKARSDLLATSVQYPNFTLVSGDSVAKELTIIVPVNKFDLAQITMGVHAMLDCVGFWFFERCESFAMDVDLDADQEHDPGEICRNKDEKYFNETCAKFFVWSDDNWLEIDDQRANDLGYTNTWSEVIVPLPGAPNLAKIGAVLDAD
jgi:hypothetical protein